MAEFFAMGGYAFYVWASYLLSGIVLAGLLLTSWRALRKRQHELEALRSLAPHRRQRQEQDS